MFLRTAVEASMRWWQKNITVTQVHVWGGVLSKKIISELPTSLCNEEEILLL